MKTQIKFYDSFVDSISDIAAQAHVTLVGGEYVFQIEAGISELIWKVPENTLAKIVFDYSNKSLQSGLIDFGKTGTSVIIKSMERDEGKPPYPICSKILIHKLVFLEDGVLDPDQSDFHMLSDSDCKNPHSKLNTLFSKALSVQNDPAKLLKGLTFSGSSHFKKLTATSDASTQVASTAQPVSEVSFYSTADGKQAFHASFNEGASVILPNSSGNITVGKDSQISISHLNYSLIDQTGSGKINRFEVDADSGYLSFGETVLQLTPGSRLSFSNLSLEKDGVTFAITDGTIQGALGNGSVINIGSIDGLKSNLVLGVGTDILLAGLQIQWDQKKSTFSGSSGRLAFIANSADLHFSSNAHLLLGSSKLEVVFECNRGADGNGTPFSWSSDGTVFAQGKILPLTADVIGGQISMPNQNFLKISSGNIRSGSIIFDSTDVVTPIQGYLNHVDLSFSVQDWHLDQGLIIGVALLHLQSDNIGITKGDAFLSGELDFDAQVSHVKAPGIGSFELTSKLSLSASRKPNDDFKIDSGRLDAQFKLVGPSDTIGSASFILSELLYYKGVGSAKLDFWIENFGTTYRIPGSYDEEGFGGGRSVITVRDTNIVAKLANRIGFSSATVKINNSEWGISDQKNIPIKFDVAVPTGPIVDIQVQTGPVAGDYARVCNPQINITNDSYQLGANIDLILSGKDKRFKIYGAALNPELQVDVSTGDCKYVAEAICALVGAAALGAIGSIGMAIACGQEIDKKKKAFHDQIETDVSQWLSALNVTVGI